MRKRLLLAATLGALAIIPLPASAHGHAQAHPNIESSFGIRIIVRDGPKVVHHPHHAKRHVRPQPWPRHFQYHAPWHHRPPHFHGRDRDHRQWLRAPGPQHFKHLRAPGPQHFKHGDGKRWRHAPGHHGERAQRHQFRHDGFERGRSRSDGRRHRD